VLGVAGLIAILSHAVPGDPVATFRHGLALIIALFAGAGLVAACLLTTRPKLPAPAADPAAEIVPAPTAR
jgi:hypothetical protein